MARFDVTAFLAEGARRAAEIDALQGRIDAALTDFTARASGDQAALFAAACAERAAGILLWKAAAEGRQQEADAYTRALEQAWGETAAGERVTSSDFDRMFELAQHDVPVRKDPLVKAAGFAECAALALRSALLLGETGDVSEVRAVSSSLWKDASLLAKRTEAADLEPEEISRQIADMATLLEDGATAEVKAALREESRRIGRQWLDLASGYAES
ncbi:hypothetical protein ABH920_002653 [Catenulispora sp. EB89]|uniref:hypothetical protein n=1 Tax=Catenulispora sp. EB89 TaxID=3156257 RepID=UPI0035137512